MTITEAKKVTTADAAKLAGVSRQAVNLAIERGELRAERVGPIWLVLESDAQAYAERMKERRTSELASAVSRAAKARDRARLLRRRSSKR